MDVTQGGLGGCLGWRLIAPFHSLLIRLGSIGLFDGFGCLGQGPGRAGAISGNAKCPGRPVESSEGGEVPEAQAAKPA